MLFLPFLQFVSKAEFLQASSFSFLFLFLSSFGFGKNGKLFTASDSRLQNRAGKFKTNFWSWTLQACVSRSRDRVSELFPTMIHVVQLKGAHFQLLCAALLSPKGHDAPQSWPFGLLRVPVSRCLCLRDMRCCWDLQAADLFSIRTPPPLFPPDLLPSLPGELGHLLNQMGRANPLQNFQTHPNFLRISSVLGRLCGDCKTVLRPFCAEKLFPSHRCFLILRMETLGWLEKKNRIIIDDSE